MAGGDAPSVVARSAVPARPGTLVAFGLFGVVLAEVVLAGVAAWPAGMTIVEAVDGFLVTNIAIGVSCGTAGVLVAWQRARYPLGWLLLAAGVFQTATAAARVMVIRPDRRDELVAPRRPVR